MADDFPEEQVHDHQLMRANERTTSPADVRLAEKQKIVEADQQRRQEEQKSANRCVSPSTTSHGAGQIGISRRPGSRQPEKKVMKKYLTPSIQTYEANKPSR